MRKIIFAVVVSIFTAGFLSIPTVFAEIEVTPIVIDVMGNKINPQDIRVTNTGDDIAYVKVTPKLITNPGTDKERLLLIDDPSKLGLLVSPRIMQIPPHKFKLIRLVFTQKADSTDRLYRVDVQPTVGDLLLPKKTNEIGIKILVGYGVVVVQRPTELKVSIQLTRKGKTLMVQNNGNTNVVLSNGKQCDSNGKNCQELPPKRIYAHQTWEQTLPYETKVTYVESYLDNSKLLKSN